jgi:hypothetical protein
MEQPTPDEEILPHEKVLPNEALNQTYRMQVNRPGKAINADTKATEVLPIGQYEMERIANPMVENVENDRSYDWLVVKGTKIGNPISILRELAKNTDDIDLEKTT